MPCVLIVEDESLLVLAAQAMLEGQGLATVTATSLPEAREILQSDRKLDLVFTDIRLGNDINAGIAVGRAARETRGDIPVLYTSGYRLTDEMQSAFVKPHIFLTKPYSYLDLEASIGQLLGGTGERDRRLS
jgi:CheY-like chemotaxis protein